MIRVADYIVERLAVAGAKHAFMITGRGILYLSDAVAKSENIQGVAVHHEQAAAFAANAYAQYNDTIGCCIVSTGCASTNTLTGVLNAWQDGVPLVVISGQNKRAETVQYTGKKIRTFGSQEADIVPVVTPITKYAKTLLDPQEIGVVMDEALWHATHGVKGPVWVDVPVDVQNMRIEEAELARSSMLDFRCLMLDDGSSKIDNRKSIIEIAEELSKAERPVVLIGSGVRAAGAIEELEELIEKQPMPVVFSASAVDTYGTANKFSIGTVGAIGCNRAANMTIQNADLVLSIGCRLSPMLTGSEYEKFARAAKLIVVDIDENEHQKGTVRIDRFVHSDAKEFLAELLTILDSGCSMMEKGQSILDSGCSMMDAGETIIDNRKSDIEPWLEKVLHWKEIFPKAEDGLSKERRLTYTRLRKHYRRCCRMMRWC